SSIKVRARFDNPKGADDRRPLTVGLFARVRIDLADKSKSLMVADRAILTDQSVKYVLVVNRAKDNTLERRPVTVSNRVQWDGLSAATGGLKGDEWIISDGVNRARPGATVNPREAPMPKRPTNGKAGG